MSTSTSITGTKINRIQRIIIEKPNGGTPLLMTVDEQIIAVGDQSTSTLMGNRTVVYDATNPLHVALYAALKAVTDEMNNGQ